MAARKKTSGGVHVIQHGAVSIQFEILYSQRKTLTLRIRPDQSITVDAPRAMPLDQVVDFVRRHGAWVIKKQKTVGAHPPPLTRSYQNGEVFRYLGREYPLQIEADTIERVRLTDDQFCVGVHDVRDLVRVRALIGRWYQRRAALVYAELLTACFPLMAPLGVTTLPPLTVRLMKSRWGSCTKAGKVTLNLSLIQAPEPLIRYVLLHELCHLKEFNHSPRFWALMDRVMPDWKAQRKALHTYPFGEIR